jgi:uncharacterized protein (DUF433 family)
VSALALFRSKRRGCSGSGFIYNKVMSYTPTEFFERRREVCGGELVIKGTRVPVRTLLASLAEGGTQEEILADFPTVSAEGLRAVIAFAAV